jgi:hypothetical protein
VDSREAEVPIREANAARLSPERYPAATFGWRNQARAAVTSPDDGEGWSLALST